MTTLLHKSCFYLSLALCRGPFCRFFFFFVAVCRCDVAPVCENLLFCMCFSFLVVVAVVVVVCFSHNQSSRPQSKQNFDLCNDEFGRGKYVVFWGFFCIPSRQTSRVN